MIPLKQLELTLYEHFFFTKGAKISRVLKGEKFEAKFTSKICVIVIKIVALAFKIPNGKNVLNLPVLVLKKCKY